VPPLAAVVVTRAGVEVTTLPPGATATVDSTEADVTTEPSWAVLVTIVAGANVELTTACPWLSVVVIWTATLVGATESRALLVWMVTLPAASVEVVTTGTRTPVAVDDGPGVDVETGTTVGEALPADVVPGSEVTSVELAEDDT